MAFRHAGFRGRDPSHRAGIVVQLGGRPVLIHLVAYTGRQLHNRPQHLVVSDQQFPVPRYSWPRRARHKLSWTAARERRSAFRRHAFKVLTAPRLPHPPHRKPSRYVLIGSPATVQLTLGSRYLVSLAGNHAILDWLGTAAGCSGRLAL